MYKFALRLALGHFSGNACKNLNMDAQEESPKESNDTKHAYQSNS
jgi:hypothetical protein